MLTFRKVNITLLGLIIFFKILQLQFSIDYWVPVLISILVLWLALTILGSFNIRWNYFLKSQHSASTKENKIALTFDDGPHLEFTPKVLVLLKKYDFKATFFCIGKNMKAHPEIVKQILADGHLVGNHSFAHTNNYGFLSTKKVIEDLNRSQDTFKEITGKRMCFFRPPFGVTNPNIARAVNQLNLKSFGWSIRTYDTVSKNVNVVFNKSISRITRGDVVLIHDTSDFSLTLLEKTLDFLKQKELKSVTLAELFNTKPYEN